MFRRWADPVTVHSPDNTHRQLAGWISGTAIVVLMLGLLYVSSGPSAGRGSAGPATEIPPVAAPSTNTGSAAGARQAQAPTANPATTAVSPPETVAVIAPPAPETVAVIAPPAPETVAVIAPPAPDTVALAEPSLPAPPVVDTIGPLTRPVVVLYGDSLAWESRQAFTEWFTDRPSVEVMTRTFGGTAICDWLDQMAADAVSLAPGIVVVEFSGNSFTPCMQDAAGVQLTGDAVTERYLVDAAAVIALFAPIGTKVVFAGAPVSGPTSAVVGRMNSLYADLADRHEGVWYEDAGAAVLDDDSYTISLPCLSSEPCEGGYNSDGLPVNIVRAPDGIHFCPVSGEAFAGVTDNCPVWSSGAYRYGRAMAQPVIEALDHTP